MQKIASNCHQQIFDFYIKKRDWLVSQYSIVFYFVLFV